MKMDIQKQACFLQDKEQIYILTSTFNLGIEKNCENIKLFDLNGNKVKIINEINTKISFIDTYHDITLDIIFILIENSKSVIL